MCSTKQYSSRFLLSTEDSFFVSVLSEYQRDLLMRLGDDIERPRAKVQQPVLRRADLETTICDLLWDLQGKG